MRKTDASREHQKTPTAMALAKVNSRLIEQISKVRASGDLALIAQTERTFIQHERDYHVTSKEQKASLESALKDFDRLELHMEMVKLPDQYGVINKAHSKPERRIGGLPKDEARQTCSSHSVRLIKQAETRVFFTGTRRHPRSHGTCEGDREALRTDASSCAWHRPVCFDGEGKL